MNFDIEESFKSKGKKEFELLDLDFWKKYWKESKEADDKNVEESSYE